MNTAVEARMMMLSEQVFSKYKYCGLTLMYNKLLNIFTTAHIPAQVFLQSTLFEIIYSVIESEP